jgi:hypothetical protein
LKKTEALKKYGLCIKPVPPELLTSYFFSWRWVDIHRILYILRFHQIIMARLGQKQTWWFVKKNGKLSILMYFLSVYDLNEAFKKFGFTAMIDFSLKYRFQ